MENTQIIAERIKTQAKIKNIPVKQILEHYSLGKNLINKLSNGSDVYSLNLLKIADYLGCSTDYLLGRVDTPNGTYTINNQNTTVSGTQANVINGNINSKDNSDTQELLELIESLPLVKRAEAIILINDLKKKENC